MLGGKSTKWKGGAVKRGREAGRQPGTDRQRAPAAPFRQRPSQQGIRESRQARDQPNPAEFRELNRR